MTLCDYAYLPKALVHETGACSGRLEHLQAILDLVVTRACESLDKAQENEVSNTPRHARHARQCSRFDIKHPLAYPHDDGHGPNVTAPNVRSTNACTK
jgi:hypothetical protein